MFALLIESIVYYTYVDVAGELALPARVELITLGFQCKYRNCGYETG
jgi:hypothetical protein